LIVGSRSIL